MSGPGGSLAVHDQRISTEASTTTHPPMEDSGSRRVSGGSSAEQHVRLACQNCQRKKIKCDRTFPCGQCSRSNLQCNPSQRKPRVRHAGKRAIDSELRNRIAKLESLVDSLGGEGEAHEPELADVSGSPFNEANDANLPALGKYIAIPFWASLTSEVQALRDALEEDQDELEDETSPSTSSNGPYGLQHGQLDYDLIVCPPGSVYVLPGALQEPSSEVQADLHAIFMENVMPFQRCYHVPTLRKFLERGDPIAPTFRLTKAALWYSAIHTVSEDECVIRFGAPKSELASQYKKYVEVMLAQVDLLCTTDLGVLQALVTYLMACRKQDHSRRVWTLAALAIRIARAMGLHCETAGRTPYDTELRRRVWHGVRFLDAYCAHDRGTEILTLPESFTTPLPSNINDDEWDEFSIEIKPHATGLTDSSFGLLTYAATATTQRLNVSEISASGDTWQQRLEIAQHFCADVQDRFLKYCDMSIPFHRLIYGVSRSVSTAMILRAVRPMQRHISSVPPRVDSPYVLQIAVDSLRESERVYDNSNEDKWRWMVWVPWHPLAVALAGLCSIRSTELAETAWPIVERALRKHSQDVADTRNGMLWRPIEKLYRKAKTFRDAGRRMSQPSAVQQHALPPYQQPFTPPFHFPTMVEPGTVSPTESPNFNPYGQLSVDPLLTGSLECSAELTPTGDMSWVDWEQIMEDISIIDPNSNGNVMTDLQQMSINSTGASMQQNWNPDVFGDLI